MATRVTPRADSASLRWHESRHGQPSVIADVRKNTFSPVDHSRNRHPVTSDISKFTPRINRPMRSGHDFPWIHCGGANFAEIYSFPSKRGFGLIPPFASSPTLQNYTSTRCLFPQQLESEAFPKSIPAGVNSDRNENTRTMRSTEYPSAVRPSRWVATLPLYRLGHPAPGHR
jgi:hypothetical protein